MCFFLPTSYPSLLMNAWKYGCCLDLWTHSLLEYQESNSQKPCSLEPGILHIQLLVLGRFRFETGSWCVSLYHHTRLSLSLYTDLFSSLGHSLSFAIWRTFHYDCPKNLRQWVSQSWFCWGFGGVVRTLSCSFLHVWRHPRPLPTSGQ